MKKSNQKIKNMKVTPIRMTAQGNKVKLMAYTPEVKLLEMKRNMSITLKNMKGGKR